MIKPNGLIICGKNKKRSKTGEHIFRKDLRFNVWSAGVSPKAEKKISEKDILWANIIFVMEQEHWDKITKEFRQLNTPKIEVLNIPDEYEYMDAELVEILQDKINLYLKKYFNM